MLSDGFMPWGDVAKMYDDNNDGKVSMAEVKAMEHVLGKGFVGFQPWFRYHLRQLDGDKDGTVLMDEMKAWMQTHTRCRPTILSKGFYKGFGFMPSTISSTRSGASSGSLGRGRPTDST